MEKDLEKDAGIQVQDSHVLNRREKKSGRRRDTRSVENDKIRHVDKQAMELCRIGDGVRGAVPSHGAHRTPMGSKLRAYHWMYASMTTIRR